MKKNRAIKSFIAFYLVTSNLNIASGMEEVKLEEFKEMEVEEFNMLDELNFVPQVQNDDDILNIDSLGNIVPSTSKIIFRCGYRENLKKYQKENNKIVLYKNYDNTYQWTKESREAILHLFANLPHDIKWKMSVDGRYHDMNDCLIFDNNRDGYEGEYGWHDSMMNTWDFIASNVNSKSKINAEFYNEIHNRALEYIELKDKPEKFFGFKWNSKFGAGGTSNGIIEFFIKSNQLNKFSKNADYNLLLSNSKIVKDANSWPNNFPKVYLKDINAYHSLRLEKHSNDSDNRNLQKAFYEYDNEIRKINNSCSWEFGFSYNEYVEGFKKIKEYFKKNFERLRTNLVSIESDLENIEFDNEKVYSDGKIKEKFSDQLCFEYPYIKGAKYMNLIDQLKRPKCTKNEAIIGAIIRLVQDLDQAHPFRDGNVRSAYSLLKLLLMKNNLLPAIMYDPNNLDFHDTFYLLKSIKEGQKKFVDLLISNKDLIFERLGIEIQVK